MSLGNIIGKSLRLIPYKAFVKLFPFFKKTKVADIVDAIYYDRFFKESKIVNDIDNYLERVRKRSDYCFITQGLWDYKIANFCFVKDMLSIILWCVDCGYIPIVDVPPKESESQFYSEEGSLWDMFFEQPLADRSKTTSNSRICPLKISPIIPEFQDARDKEKVEFWNRITELFLRYNQTVLEYFSDEYESLIKNKKVIACVLRSTDYTKTRPKGHPVQPSVTETVEKLRIVMREYEIDHIYLATEDYNIASAFKKSFQNKIIENKRLYFNQQFDDENMQRVSEVHFDRDNDAYFRMLEYMSSINLVSKCDYLVTGLSGGSEMAIYWNGNQYKYSYIFNKGVY